ncbi:MAG: flagellar biosynthetic protein FliO [Candidatus Zixiibacteriota bacterium]
MIKNKARRTWLIAAIVVAAALLGLAAIDTGPISAQPDQDAVTKVGSSILSGDDSTGPASYTSQTMPAMLKMLSALVVVIACIYGAIYLLKRLNGRRHGGSRRKQLLEVLETVYVAPRRSIALVRVMDRAVLVGVADNSISVLTELEATTLKDLNEEEEAASQSTGFADLLSSITTRLGSVRTKEDSAPQQA